jgi:hypothetical protein
LDGNNNGKSEIEAKGQIFNPLLSNAKSSTTPKQQKTQNTK